MSKIHLLRKPQGEKLQIFVPWVSHGHKRESKIFVRYNSASPKFSCCHAKGYCARQQEKEYHAKNGDNDLNAEAGTPLSRSAA
jgi:hypothetical protein